MTGDITYKDVVNVFPFCNSAIVAEITGQQFLDLLEYGASSYPEENGSFIHVSGASYTIDESVESSVKLNDKGEFVGVDGEYRVKNVLVGGKPLDLQKKYSVGSVDYFLKNGGDRYIASGKCKILNDGMMLDNDLLAKYIGETLGGEIPEKYADPSGQGRITFASSAVTAENDDAPAENPATGTALPSVVIAFVSLAVMSCLKKR